MQNRISYSAVLFCGYCFVCYVVRANRPFRVLSFVVLCLFVSPRAKPVFCLCAQADANKDEDRSKSRPRRARSAAGAKSRSRSRRRPKYDDEGAGRSKRRGHRRGHKGHKKGKKGGRRRRRRYH